MKCKGNHCRKKAILGRRCDGCRAYSRDWARAHRARSSQTPEQKERARCRAKAWYAGNKMRALAYAKERLKLPHVMERQKSSQRRYYDKNRSAVIARAVVWLAKNKDDPKRRAYTRAYAKRWRREHPEMVKEQKCARKHRLRAAGPLLPSTIRFVKLITCCAFCNSKEWLTVDHLIAASKGGTNHISNLIRVCRSCNSSKQASAWELWFKKQRFFDERRAVSIRSRVRLLAGIERIGCP